jgi:hypothetical protein
MGVGRALVRIRALEAMTLRGAIATIRGRALHLARILGAPAIQAGDGHLEVHMLLHHQRILEGIWALYSFAHFSQSSCRIFVHSDGSLTQGDALRLQQVLPGAQVISRDEADHKVVSHLRNLGLSTSIRFRDQLVFARKLFDPFFYGEQAGFFLLDSDVLFFRRPRELLDGVHLPGEPVSLYSPDNGFRYCLGPEALRALLGQECIANFNPGVVRTGRSVLDLARIESFLQRPEFWGSSSRPQ